MKAFLSLLILIFLPCYSAASDEQFGEEVFSSLEARKLASAFSFDNHGIGVSFSYGTQNQMSAEAIGETFVKGMREKGIPAKYFFYKTDRSGVAMEFAVGYSTFGPWSAQHAASQFSIIIKRAEAMRNILAD